MNHHFLKLPLLLAGALAASLGSTSAAVYTQNFNSFANGTTNLGDGTVIASFAVGGASVQAGALVLTRDGVNSENGTFKIPGFVGAANGWTAEFDLTITDAAAEGNPADGVSFNWGNFPLDASLSANAGGPEHGWTQTFNHLAFQVDTYNINGGDNGVRIAAYPSGGEFLHAQNVGNILLDGTSVTGHVIVSWNPVDGASMTTTGFLTNANFSGLNIPGLLASDSNVFAFASRTGGANETVIVDNFVLSAAPGVGIATPNLAISELVVDNTKHEDEHCQTPGWVELYNGTAAAISLDGWSLTDDAGTPAKWTFPNGLSIASYGHLMVYFGHGTPPPTAPDSRLHASFQPAKTGGYLGLYQGVTEVDALNTYPQQFEDVAYGHLGAAWTLGFLETPTPGIRNSGTQSPGGPSQGEVAFSLPGGLITGSMGLTLSVAPLPAPQPVPGAVIRYTTNNTAPTPSSTQYTAPLNITNSTIVRARIFEPGRLPGDITTRCYILLAANVANYRGTGAFNSNLPVIVFDSFGINIDGAGGSPGLRPFRAGYSVVFAPDPARGNRTILDTTAPIDFQGRCGTHVRGETSAGFVQKPYAWELWDNEDGDKDASILGMPADSDWILISNFNDKGLLRNILPFQTLREAHGPSAATRTMYVEVFFNQVANSNLGWEDYRGVYILTEKIKRGNQRVDIAKLDPCDGVFTNNPAVDDASVISGGYIIRRDKVSPEVAFGTPNYPYNAAAGQLGLQIVEPSAPSTAQVSYIQNYMTRFEASLNTPTDPVNNFYRYADVDSFIYNAWWVEIFKQIDGYRLSTYYYKDRGGKLRAHPLWDYNLSLGNANYATGMDPTLWYFNNGGGFGGIEYAYYQKMFAHAPTNVRRWDLYWKHRRGIFENNAILSRIDSMVAQVRDNQAGTSDIWNGTGVFPNSVPNVESPTGRQNARYQRIGLYDWPNADGFATRTRFDSPMTAASALALTGTAANEYGLETVTSDVAHTKAWLIKRLDWIDNALFAGTSNTILRAPVFSSSGGNVTAPHSLTITPYTGTAPAAALYGKTGTLNYATGPVYYTTDGSDPILAPTSAIPGTPRPFVLDNNACEVVLPTAAATTGETDAALKNWKDWDFNGATANPVWKTGLNGVGFDNAITAPAVSYYPYINIYMRSAGTFPAGATPIPPVIYGPPDMFTTAPTINYGCYIRLPFTLTAADLTGVTGLRIYGRVDDGFVAWVNGVRIADSNAPVSIVWNTGATGLQPGSDNDVLTYKEFTTYSVPAAIAALRVGTNVLAIRGLQSGTGSSDFLMRFKLDGDVGGTPANPGGVSPVAQLYSSPVTINSSTTIRARQVNTATGDATPMTEATFVVDTVPAAASNLVVSEIMYNSTAPTAAEVAAGHNDQNMFEYLEVMNIGSSSVDMSGVNFSGAFTFAWPNADPNLRVLPPSGRAVVVGDVAAFNYRYTPAPGVKIAGVLGGNLSNGGERVVLTGPGGTIKDFTYSDDPPWPVEADGAGYSLVLNNPAANPDHNSARSWRSSFEVNGTPGTAPGPAGPTGSAAAALADTDLDGMVDLVEFATGSLLNDGSSHHWPTTATVREIVPPALTPDDYLHYSYTRSRSADGFTFEPEVSTVLTGWQPLSTLFTFVGQANNPDGTATHTWRSTQPAASLPARLFLQVRAGITP